MRTNERRALTLALIIPLAAATLWAQPAPAPAAAAPAAQPDARPVLPAGLRAVGPQAGFGDILVLGTGARLELADASDQVTLDGAPASLALLAGPWAPGRHAITVRDAGVDLATAAPPPALQFVYDPAAPILQWEVGDTRLLDSFGLDQNVDRDKPPHKVQPERDKHVPILWSPDGRRWLPLLAKGAKADGQGALADWLIAADRPQVFLWALEDGTLGQGAPVQPKKLQLVRIWGGDALSAVRELRLRVLPGDAHDAGKALQLELLATDLVGNQVSERWPLIRH